MSNIDQLGWNVQIRLDESGLRLDLQTLYPAGFGSVIVRHLCKKISTYLLRLFSENGNCAINKIIVKLSLCVS